MASREKKRKCRLDELLVERGVCPTRSQARAFIMAGNVRDAHGILDKPGKSVPAEIALTFRQQPRFVGRGGEKLEGFLEQFPLHVKGWAVLDVGASTGGFTDCLLQRGAASVVCVDVGRGQLHDKLRRDPRVTSLEKVNARYIDAKNLPRPYYDLIVIDLSFISLRKVLPAIWSLLNEDGYLIALVKPQFEAQKKEADKGGGIIRDPVIRQRVLREIRDFAAQKLPNCREMAHAESRLAGAEGNIECFLALKKEKDSPAAQSQNIESCQTGEN